MDSDDTLCGIQIINPLTYYQQTLRIMYLYYERKPESIPNLRFLL